jgi:hypothetical protein
VSFLAFLLLFFLLLLMASITGITKGYTDKN